MQIHGKQSCVAECRIPWRICSICDFWLANSTCTRDGGFCAEFLGKFNQSMMLSDEICADFHGCLSGILVVLFPDFSARQ